MGSETDVLKLVSSMTLFREAARRAHRDEGLPDAEELAARADIVLRVAAEQGYPPCAVTRRQLGV
jgi:hypothetical protein